MAKVTEIDRRTMEDRDRADITQVLYRYCRGVDRGDVGLLQSVFHEDATDDHGIWQGRGQDFGPWVVETFKDATTSHMITNVMIELDGDRADCESYCLAFSESVADRLMVHSRNIDRFERRNDEWKIAHRLVVFGGIRADPPAKGPDLGPNITWASRGADDALYRLASVS